MNNFDRLNFNKKFDFNKIIEGYLPQLQRNQFPKIPRKKSNNTNEK